MAEPESNTLRRALIAHEPEPLPLTAVFSTSWRVFTNHLRFLLTTAAATAAVPLLVVLILTAIFGPIVQAPTGKPDFPWGPHALQKHHSLPAHAPAPAHHAPAPRHHAPAPAPHGHAPAPGPAPAPKFNPIELGAVTAFNFLLSGAAHVILVAVFVYVVLGDHVGRKPGPVWGVIKGSFWRLLGTDIATGIVTLAVTFLLGAVVALVGGVVTGIFFKGASPSFAAGVTLAVYLILALPITLFIITGLALSDPTTAVEGAAGVWGFAALRRSWQLSKGNRGSILAVVLLGALVSIVLGSPLEILVNNFQEGSAFAGAWWQIVVGVLGALLVFLVSVFAQAYLQVVLIELYLSSRKKAEPEFGLSAIERYFEAGAAGTGGYSPARTWDP